MRHVLEDRSKRSDKYKQFEKLLTWCFVNIHSLKDLFRAGIKSYSKLLSNEMLIFEGGSMKIDKEGILPINQLANYPL